MYRKLTIVISINNVIVFLITYLMMVNLAYFYININKFYMARMMVVPMVIVMLLVMRSMYENNKAILERSQ